MGYVEHRQAPQTCRQVDQGQVVFVLFWRARWCLGGSSPPLRSHYSDPSGADGREGELMGSFGCHFSAVPCARETAAQSGNG